MNCNKYMLEKESQEAKLGRTIIKIVNPFNNWFKFAINLLAVAVSWYFNKSILWAVFAYIFSFFYLIYSLLTGRFADGGFMDIINSYI